MSAPVLEVAGLKKHFPVGGQLGGKGVVYAVDGVSFTIGAGEVLGLVGESGSGKSTVAFCIMRLLDPTDGEIRLEGREITSLSRRKMRPLRRQLHMVFQDPYSSLNPRAGRRWDSVSPRAPPADNRPPRRSRPAAQAPLQMSAGPWA